MTSYFLFVDWDSGSNYKYTGLSAHFGSCNKASLSAATINTAANDTRQDIKSDSEGASVCSETEDNDTLSKTDSSQNSTQSGTDLAKERTT